MRLLAPIITPRLVDLARTRVLTGESFFFRDKLREEVGVTKGELKMILLIVLEINPREDLDANEQGADRGMGRERYMKLSQAGELVR